MGYIIDDIQKNSLVECTALELIEKKRIEFKKAIHSKLNHTIATVHNNDFAPGTFKDKKSDSFLNQHNKQKGKSQQSQPTNQQSNKANLEKKNSLSKYSLWKNPRKIGPGLTNLGNTCYLNSVLQCLTYTPTFAQSLLLPEMKDMFADSNYFCMLRIMNKHITNCIGHPNSPKVIHPKSIVMNLKRIAKHFRLGRQEDSHEFLRHLLDALQQSCLRKKAIKENSPLAENTYVHRIFGGKLRSQVKCSKCQHVSCVTEPFLDLSLELSNGTNNVQGALKHFTAEETLDQSNQWRCSGCKQFSQAKKSLLVQNAPNILILHLKRFSYFSGKINRHINYSETLELQSNINPEKARYKLYGVLVHAGYSTNSGHYYSYVKDPTGNWHEMDDCSVRWVNINKVLQQQAYILFYVKVGQQNHINTSPLRNGDKPQEKKPQEKKLQNLVKPLKRPITNVSKGNRDDDDDDDDDDTGTKINRKKTKFESDVQHKEKSNSIVANHESKSSSSHDLGVNERRHSANMNRHHMDNVDTKKKSSQLATQKGDVKSQLNQKQSHTPTKAPKSENSTSSPSLDALATFVSSWNKQKKETSDSEKTIAVKDDLVENKIPAPSSQVQRICKLKSHPLSRKTVFSRSINFQGNLGKLLKFRVFKRKSSTISSMRKSSKNISKGKKTAGAEKDNSKSDTSKNKTALCNLKKENIKEPLTTVDSSTKLVAKNDVTKGSNGIKWNPKEFGGCGLYGKNVNQWNDEDDNCDEEAMRLQTVHNRLLRDSNRSRAKELKAAKLSTWDAHLDQGKLKKVKGTKEFIRNDGGHNSFQNAYARKGDNIQKSFKKKSAPRKSSNPGPNRR